MKNFIKFANGLIILSFCIIIFSIITGLNKNNDVIKNGVLDASNISIKGSAIDLNGEWEFYLGQLVSSDGKIQNTKNKQLVKVPSSWTKYKGKDNKNLPVDGYGVYRIVIKASKGDNLALKIPQIGSSYNLWLNGKIRYSSGQVGKDASESKPKWTTKVVNFTVEKEYTEIMFEVSNFHYFRAGITTPIIIGTENQIQKLKYDGLFLDSSIFAALSVMSIFFLLLYLLHTHNKSYIYLALFSIAIAIRPLLYGECYFNNLFPNINFEIDSKIYLVSFIAIQLFFLYCYYQYQNLISKKFLHIIGWPLILIIIVGVILPAKDMMYTVILLEMMIPIVVLICIYLFYIAYRNKCEEVGINILSVLLLCFLAIVDVLNNSEIIKLNIYYTPIAMLIITFIQTFLQVCKFRESGLLNERLAYEIEIKNLKLKYEIGQRALTEKLNNGLKAMVSTLDIQELLVGMADNLSRIIEFDNIVITLNVDENVNIIANKVGNNSIKCVEYEGEINFSNDNLIYEETKFEQVQIIKLHTLNGNEKNLIVKPLYNKEGLLCVIKLVLSCSKEIMNNDIMQLINIYSEQSSLALQNAKSYKKIKELAMYDELTKIYNRRYLMKLGTKEFNLASNFSAAMLDIDYFKRVNDTYGHLFGDVIIKTIANICKKCMPKNSIIGRYGGEEFIIFFKDIEFDATWQLLEELRRQIQNYSYSYNDNERIKVTVSIGVAVKQKQNENLYNLINNADKALYEAKNSGRNCIMTFNEQRTTVTHKIEKACYNED